jgi:uncharacterized protein
VQYDLTINAGDGVPLRLSHHEPVAPGIGVTVWIRTPYGRRGIAAIAKRFAKSGAHVIVEAMRGTDGSGGEFNPFELTPDDARSVLAWLREQSWFGGVIATWGLSAIGYASWALTELDVPEWRLAILQDAPSELYDGLVYPGGIFAGKVMLGFLGGIEWQRRHWRASLPRTMLASVRAARRTTRVLNRLPLGSADQHLVGHRIDYFQDWLTHESDAEYWKRGDQRRKAPRMPPRVHLATGWYDICLASTLADYHALCDAGKQVRLIIGPWYHGRGAVDKALRADVDTWLAADDTATNASAVRVHVSGRNEWRDLPDWPPPGCETSTWHLHPGGVLASQPAAESVPDHGRYDPAHPTPSVGGATENFDGSAGAQDNRELESRPDVLTYTSDPMSSELEVIGPVSARIVVRSSLQHTDIHVRLCDVAPDGRSVNLCDGARRLGAAEPEPAADDTRTVELDLAGIAHVFNVDHRIRLQVSSGAHPRLVRNTGSGEPLATATTLRAAEQEIFHEPAHPSTLNLPCANARRMPET